MSDSGPKAKDLILMPQVTVNYSRQEATDLILMPQVTVNYSGPEAKAIRY